MRTERAAFQHYLANQRGHVVGILEGLTDEQLRQPVLPSGWNCLQLVNHLTWDVEHFWFQCVMAGNLDGFDIGANAWELPEGTTALEIMATYRRECELSDAVIADREFDAGPVWWPTEIFPDFPEQSLRELILHVTAETAAHAGHLDAVRELLDHRQWFVLT